MAKDCGGARVYDLATYRDHAGAGRRCAICGTDVRPGTRWADLEGRVWDVCRPCGDEATAAAH